MRLVVRLLDFALVVWRPGLAEKNSIFLSLRHCDRKMINELNKVDDKRQSVAMLPNISNFCPLLNLSEEM